MAKRSRLSRKVDQKVFTNSAKKTKDINVKPVNMRGGKRL